MATPTFDSDALRAEWNANRSGEASAPAPESTPEAPVADPAIETPPPQEAPPAAPPEGTPSGEGQPPAPDDNTLAYAAKLAGGSDPIALSRRLIEYNNRLAAMVREQKAAVAQAQAPPQPPPPAPPAPEPEPTPEAVQQDVERWAATDSECRRLHTEYHENKARIAEIGVNPATGQYLKTGLIPTLNERIQLLTLHIDPQARQRAGIELPEMDEFKLSELRATLSELRVQRADLLAEARERRTYGQSLSQGFDERLEAAKREYLAPYEARRREADREAEIERKTVEFAESFRNEFENAYTRYAAANPWIKEQDIKADFLQGVTIRAKADVSVLDNVQQFMDGAFKAELAVGERWHRHRSRGYAAQKLADGRQQAPPGAVAPPLPTSTTDWEAALRREARQIRAANRR